MRSRRTPAAILILFGLLFPFDAQAVIGIINTLGVAAPSTRFSDAPSPAQSFWQPTNGPYGGRVESFAIDSTGTIYAGTIYAYTGVFRSDDLGVTWTQADSGLPDYGATMALATGPGDHVFAGTLNDGVFLSTDHGNTWIPVNAGLSNLSVLSLIAHPSGDLFAGTLGGGVFRLANPDSSWVPADGIPSGTQVEALVVGE